MFAPCQKRVQTDLKETVFDYATLSSKDLILSQKYNNVLKYEYVQLKVV